MMHEFEKGHKYEVHYHIGEKKFMPRIVDVTNSGARRGYLISWGQV